MRDILRDAVKHEPAASGGLGSEIAAMHEGIGFTDEEVAEIEGIRGHPVIPITFEE